MESSLNNSNVKEAHLRGGVPFFTEEESGNVYVELENGNEYSHVWVGQRRFKIERAGKRESDVNTNIFMVGISECPPSMDEYKKAEGKTYCVPFEIKESVEKIGLDFIGKQFDESVYDYAGMFSPKTLKVIKESEKPVFFVFSERRVTVITDEAGLIKEITIEYYSRK